ncbi:MAG: hypothetical protein AAF195_04970 [Pseudomonadota bacterium]
MTQGNNTGNRPSLFSHFARNPVMRLLAIIWAGNHIKNDYNTQSHNNRLLCPNSGDLGPAPEDCFKPAPPSPPGHTPDTDKYGSWVSSLFGNNNNNNPAQTGNSNSR